MQFLDPVHHFYSQRQKLKFYLWKKWVCFMFMWGDLSFLVRFYKMWNWPFSEVHGGLHTSLSIKTGRILRLDVLREVCMPGIYWQTSTIFKALNKRADRSMPMPLRSGLVVKGWLSCMRNLGSSLNGDKICTLLNQEKEKKEVCPLHIKAPKKLSEA